jgi:hypothetical protein
MKLLLLAGGLIWLGCQPGTLPCSKDKEWEAICANVDGGGGGLGGASGSGGGSGGGGAQSGGSGGGMADGGGSGGNGGVTASTPVMNCADWKTAGEMDKFFQTKCGGDNSACHSTNGAFGDYKTADFWSRLNMGLKSKFTCGMVPLADTADHTKGLLWARAQEMPKCPNGSSAGARMPPLPMPALNATEMACLENFVKLFVK